MKSNPILSFDNRRKVLVLIRFPCRKRRSKQGLWVWSFSKSLFLLSVSGKDYFLFKILCLFIVAQVFAIELVNEGSDFIDFGLAVVDVDFGRTTIGLVDIRILE